MITPASLLFPLLLPPAGAQEQHAIELGVEDGAVLQKVWSAEHRLVLEKFERRYGDDPPLTQELRLRLDSEHVIEVVDEYREVVAGRPTDLRRTYLSARVDATQTLAGDQPLERGTRLVSPFEGVSVVFTWIDEEGGYGRYYDAAELDEEWLASVRDDFDLRAVLPAGPVAVGASWSMDPQDLRDLLAPCGNLQLAASEATDQADRLLQRSLRAGVGGSLAAAFGGQASGTIEVTLAAVEGDRATLALRLSSLVYLRDITDFAEENRLRVEDEAGVERTTGRLVLELDGEGQVLWNLSAGRAERLDLSATQRVRIAVTLRGGEAGNQEYEDRLSMSGKLEVQCAIAPAATPPPPPPGPAAGK